LQTMCLRQLIVLHYVLGILICTRTFEIM
jgi:hypothetical protein